MVPALLLLAPDSMFDVICVEMEFGSGSGEALGSKNIGQTQVALIVHGIRA